jgi:uncharacterized Zn finger protein (UPF0148 family)
MEDQKCRFCKEEAEQGDVYCLIHREQIEIEKMEASEARSYERDQREETNYDE